MTEKYPLPLPDLVETIAGIESLPERLKNCHDDSYDVPTAETLGAATRFVAALYTALHDSKKDWICPHVAADASGEVILEWWVGIKKITIYVTATGAIEYVFSWGSDMNTEMEADTMTGIEEGVRLWSRLVSPTPETIRMR